MTSRLNFFFTEALRSLSTNVATSVAATLCMFVALLLVGVFLFLLWTAFQTIDQIESQASVVKVYLNDTATDDEVNALKDQLEKMTVVKNVSYVSKEDALKRAKDQFKEEPEVIASLPGNPFPRSLEADIKDTKQIDTVAHQVEGQPGVKDVNYGGKTAKKAIHVVNVLRTAGGAVLVLLLAASTALVANTIRLSVFARRREIEVMKLVGASNMFVRLPFMIEGFLCGIAGALGAIVILLLGKGWLDSLHRALHLEGSVAFVEIFAILLGMGILLGGFGSGLTLRRFLRI